MSMLRLSFLGFFWIPLVAGATFLPLPSAPPSVVHRRNSPSAPPSVVHPSAPPSVVHEQFEGFGTRNPGNFLELQLSPRTQQPSPRSQALSDALLPAAVLEEIHRKVWEDGGLQQPLPLGAKAPAKVVQINDAATALAAKLYLMSRAQSTIEVSFNFGGGEPFQRVLDLLESKMKSAVLVSALVSNTLFVVIQPADVRRLLKMWDTHCWQRERRGELCLFRLCLTDAMAGGKGGVYEPTNPGEKVYSNRLEENHSKMLIVDSKFAVVGSSGIEPTMISENPNRILADAHMLTTDIHHWKPHQEWEKYWGLSAYKEADALVEGDRIVGLLRQQFWQLFCNWRARMAGYGKDQPLIWLRSYPSPATNANMHRRCEAGAAGEQLLTAMNGPTEPTVPAVRCRNRACLRFLLLSSNARIPERIGVLGGEDT